MLYEGHSNLKSGDANILVRTRGGEHDISVERA